MSRWNQFGCVDLDLEDEFGLKNSIKSRFDHNIRQNFAVGRLTYLSLLNCEHFKKMKFVARNTTLQAQFRFIECQTRKRGFLISIRTLLWHDHVNMEIR